MLSVLDLYFLQFLFVLGFISLPFSPPVVGAAVVCFCVSYEGPMFPRSYRDVRATEIILYMHTNILCSRSPSMCYILYNSRVINTWSNRPNLGYSSSGSLLPGSGCSFTRKTSRSLLWKKAKVQNYNYIHMAGGCSKTTDSRDSMQGWGQLAKKPSPSHWLPRHLRNP